MNWEEANMDEVLKRPIICVDLDGTLAEYNGWKGPNHIGRLVPGARKFMKWLEREGYEIGIFTTRKDTPFLREWLRKNSISYTWINENPRLAGLNHVSNKPYYHVLIDDRAVNFDRNWDNVKWGVLRIVEKNRKGDKN